MSYARQYFQHTVVTVGATVLNGILFYALRIVLYQRLPVEDYGLFYGVFSAGLAIFPVLTFGLNPGMVPLVTELNEERQPGALKGMLRQVCLIQTLLAAGFLGLVWLAAQPIARYGFGDPGAADLVRLIALYTALQAAFQIGLNLLLGLQSIALRNLTETVRIVFCFAFVYALLHSGGTSAVPAWGYIWSTFAATALVVVIVALYHRELLTAPVNAGHPGLRDVFRVGKYLSIAFGGVLVFSQMDTVMLSAMTKDMNAVAAYQLAVPTLMILYALILAGARNFMPMASVLAHRNQYELLGAGLKRIFEAAFAVIVPATALMACYSDVLMETLFRSDVMGAPAAFNILAVGSIFFFTCNICLNTLAGVDQSRQAALAIGAALVLNVALNLVLIRLFGILGAASATVASHFVATAISLVYMRRRVPFHLSFVRLASPVLASVLISALALALRKTDAFNDYPQLGAAAACCLLYAGALAVLEFTGLARLRELARTFQYRKEYQAVDSTPPAG